MLPNEKWEGLLAAWRDSFNQASHVLLLERHYADSLSSRQEQIVTAIRHAVKASLDGNRADYEQAKTEMMTLLEQQALASPLN